MPLKEVPCIEEQNVQNKQYTTCIVHMSMLISQAAFDTDDGTSQSSFCMFYCTTNEHPNSQLCVPSAVVQVMLFVLTVSVL